MFGYLVAILLPPVPMFQQGRMVSAVVTFLLCCTLVGWPIASILAVMATRNSHVGDKRVARMTKQQLRLCPVCGSQVKAGWTSCPRCQYDFAAAAAVAVGAGPQSRQCPACGVQVPIGMTACGNCRHDFAAAAAIPAGRPS